MSCKFFIRTALLLLCSSKALFAQQAVNKYEVFSVNGQKGIVEIATLEEILEPHKDNEALEISNKYFLLWQQDTVRPFNKQTGAWEKSLPIVRSQPTVDLNNKEYLHVIAHKKSVLYDGNMKLRYSLPGLYTDFFPKRDLIPDGFLIAKAGKKAHVLALKGDQFVLLHQLEATSFSNEVLEQPDGSTQEVGVLFGGAHTYVFNRKFELIKTIDSFVQSDLYLDRLLNPAARRMGTANGPDYAASTDAPDLSFRETGSDAHHIYYTTGDGKVKLNVNKNMKVVGKEGSMIWVYKVNRTEKEDSSAVSYGAANSYGFLLDRARGKALIPGKYYTEMGLQVLFIR